MAALSPQQLLQRRVYRLTFGIVVACFAAFSLDFPLANLILVLTAKFLTIPAAPSVKGLLVLVLSLIVMPLLFSGFVMLFGFEPQIMIVMLSLLLVWFYYLGTEQKFVLLATFGIIFLVLISFFGVLNGVAVTVLTENLIKVSVIALLIYMLAHSLFPEPQQDFQLPTSPYSEFVRTLIAVKSVIVLMPLLVYYLYVLPSHALLVLVFSAMFLMQVSTKESLKAIKLYFIVNIVSALLAIATYEFFVMIPSLVYLLLFMATIGMYFGREIFIGSKLGKVYAGAITGYLVLFSGLALSNDNSIDAKSWDRLVQILFACSYIVIVAHSLERWLFRRWKVRFAHRLNLTKAS
ncbi:DUF2955 domain-containing protein [Neiella sp. HB171785]|uniref:DUF2955 domain-containing protein n=1 Tax=Neiella litorisoli TaxID=2771431 RepID=A0A8J6UPE7_9GAMM|nr:DUF2955 domain-containing protein [Neiella litorisoli]MBD1388142.1 DUF2955 domain-containing protein [Neiella litorisoli]